MKVTAAAASLILVLAAGLTGCAATLEPAPEARLVPGMEGAAVGEFAGVEIVATAESWRGSPPDIDEVVTPMLVTITNQSQRRLELRYEDFALMTPGRVQFAALPPFQITGVAYAPIDVSGPPMGFHVAPYLSPWYPGWSVWEGPFPYRASYYDAYSTGFLRVALPSGDMIQKAIPEGVLAPGGRVTGFLYFEQVADVRHISLVARLVDATTEEVFGTIEIPFIVD